MAGFRQYFNRQMTLRDTAVVIALVLMFAGLCYGVWSFVAAKLLEAHVRVAATQLSGGIRKERDEIVSAIDAYKTHFGFYPPDTVINRNLVQVDAISNRLAYELIGFVYNPTNRLYQAGRLEPAEAKFVNEFFHCDGFKNSSQREDQVKHFLPADNKYLSQLHDDPDVFALGFQMMYEGITQELANEIEISSWRYVCSAPTNNPGKYDLWLDLRAGRQNITIGNWKAAE
jgi:hypothetical protein